jgi:vancomycin permeability regulator SanA
MDNDWLERVPAAEVALVLGAGVKRDGTPSQYLQWRVETAVELYKAGKVRTLLMSGNAENEKGSEPAVMSKYAQKLGVAEADIVLDNAGYTTYESCYRVKRVFGYDDVIAVTQGYHVPRSVAFCQGLGVKTVGVAAKHDRRDFTAWYLLREMLATDKAVMQLILKPEPATLNR